MTNCPKCGSDRVLKDECLKCGVIISKFVKSQQDPFAPATGSVPQPVFIPPDTMAVYQAARRRSKIQTHIITAVILITVFGGGYLVYDLLKHKAASYGGFYRQSRYLFTIWIPEKGWKHYYESELKDLKLQPQDAFYLGDHEEPDILVAIFVDFNSVNSPLEWDQKTQEDMERTAREKIVERMEKSGIPADIAGVEVVSLGALPGLKFTLDLKNELTSKSIVYCAFNGTRSYTFHIVGSEEAMEKYGTEAESIATSIGFNLSII